MSTAPQTKLFASPDLKTAKTIRIAVSGDVPLTRLEWTIIDTPEFQRLRRIKQLGTTYLVYPTALHTRFDHSLGTQAMALHMIRAIRANRHNVDDEGAISDEEELLIRLFALLHDIAHIPFGHTLEDEFCIFPRHDLDQERTEFFLAETSTIGKLLLDGLGRSLYDRFIRIYCSTKETADQLGEDRFIYDLVNDTACADLLDYQKRDAYFCNVSIETEYRFLKYLSLQRQDGVRRLVIRLWKRDKSTPRPDLLNELIRLLDNRYLLSERVYFHHARLITGAMIAGAVARAVAKNQLKKRDCYTLGDEELLQKLSTSKGNGQRLINCLQKRQLWKRMFERTAEQVNGQQAQARNIPAWKTLMDDWWKSPAHRIEAEELIASLFGMKSGDVLIHCPEYKMSMKLAEMTVLWNGDLRPLRECTDDALVGHKLDAILNSHKGLWALRMFVSPEQQTKKAAIEVACGYLFNLTDRDTEARKFFRFVAEEHGRTHAEENIGHDAYLAKTDTAVDRLMALTAKDRSAESILTIIEHVFKAHTR